MDRLKNRDDLHILKTICEISVNEDLADLTSLIQKQLLPTFGATCWVWYWQVSKQAPIELISVVTSQKYYSTSNNHSSPIVEIDEKMIAKNVSVLSSNEHFNYEDKIALLVLLKKQLPLNVKEFLLTRHKVIIQAPDLLGFAVLALTEFIPRNTQLIEMITPVMLLQKRNLIRKEMIRHNKTLLNESSGECNLALIDQTYQVLDCTSSFKEIFAGNYQHFNEVISDLLRLRNSENCTTEFQSLDYFKTVYRCGRRTYEVLIKSVGSDDSKKLCLWLVRLNRLFNEESRGLRKLRDAGLTNREIEICANVCKGNSNDNIATQLSISLNTVKNHLKHIFEKLNVSSRFELTVFLDCKVGR